MNITRRTLSKLLLAAPIAAASCRPTEPPPAGPTLSAVGRCIAQNEPGLSDEERARAEKGMISLEQALKTIRDYKLPADTDPAFRFSALASRPA